MTTSQAELAEMNIRAAASLAKAAEALGDKITWKPLDKGRSALEQVQECIGMAMFGKTIFETQSVPAMNREDMEKLQEAYADSVKALAGLTSATAEFAKAIENFPADKLGNKVMLPFGGGMEKSFGEVAMMAYWNTVYHEGQVNYIQTLAGV